MHQAGTEQLSGKDRRLANLAPPWPPGVSGNPNGRVSRRSLHNKFVGEIIAELGDVGSIDRILVDQAAWMLVQADDLQRQRNHGKPISNDDLTRARNGATRILMQLRASRPDPAADGMTLAKYSALQATEKVAGS